MVVDSNYKYGSIRFPDDLRWLEDSARRFLTPRQFEQVRRYDDIGHLILAGKKLVQHLTFDQKLRLIDLGASIANQGEVKPSECWLVDKLDSAKYVRDGSNFYYIAKKVSLPDVVSLKSRG